MSAKYLCILFVTLMLSGAALGGCLEAAPFIYTIEEAVYDLKIDQYSISGEMLVSGKIISGGQGSIRLLGNEVVLTDIERSRGGTLTLGGNGSAGVDFITDGRKKEFQIIVSFLLRPQEDARSRFASISIPPALKNSLKLISAKGIVVIEQPGIMDSDGIRHFGASEEIFIRYRGVGSEESISDVEVDTFSRIRPQGKRAIITTTFVPVRPLPVSFVLKGQKNSQMLSSSLKSSWMEKAGDASYKITIPSAESGSFWIQFAVEDEKGAGEYRIALPAIEENNGREGNFVVEEPDDGRVSLTGEGLIKDLSVSVLADELKNAMGNSRSYMHAPSGAEIRLDVSRFETVSTPPIVLDSQSYYVAFEENGNVLTVLEMNIPPDTGSKLKLKAVAETEIWSLDVNGRKRKVYRDKDDRWIIPLDADKASKVKLSLLRKSEKLGLHGSLELSLPETGLSSKFLKVGIALPPRVQLLSLEGPLSPDSCGDDTGPEEFIGKPYYFSRSFYQGQGMEVAVFYKEPVKQ